MRRRGRLKLHLRMKNKYLNSALGCVAWKGWYKQCTINYSQCKEVSRIVEFRRAAIEFYGARTFNFGSYILFKMH
jgi:hypothetical protein